MAHEAGALVLIDGAQAVPHLPVDVAGASAPTSTRSAATRCSARRARARCGRRRELLEAMPPFMAGGEMIREVHLRRSRLQRRSPGSSRRARRTSAPRSASASAADYLDGPRHGRRPRARARARRVRARRAAARGAGHRALRADGPGPARRRRAVQPAGHPPARRGPGPRPVRRSRSAPATTARCRSTSGSTWPPRRAPRSASTRRATTSTRWPPASSRSRSCSGSRPSRSGRPARLAAAQSAALTARYVTIPARRAYRAHRAEGRRGVIETDDVRRGDVPVAALPTEMRPARGKDVLRPLGRRAERHRDHEAARRPERDHRRVADGAGRCDPRCSRTAHSGKTRRPAERASEAHRRE